MRRYIDLHMHTCHSDGVKTAQELLDIVRSKKIKAFSVTDHDTLEGYLAVRDLLTETDPELVSGLELSVACEDGELHLLAYLFDPEHTGLNGALADFQRRRNQRGRLIVEKLNGLGLNLTYEDVVDQLSGSVVGRPHIAAALYEQGLTDFYEEAFQKYIGFGGPAYVPKEGFTPDQAVKLIHEAGGLVVLAHPAIDDRESYLEMLLDMGLDGIEAYHPSCTASQSDRYVNLAERYRLVVTGGSDFHGREGRAGMIGSQKVPYRFFELLKERVQNK